LRKRRNSRCRGRVAAVTLPVAISNAANSVVVPCRRSWLEAVATWLNHEYVWDVPDVIPPCWPQHPHLVHEIAVLADQRRRAGLAPTSDALEEWHRYSLPSFTERMKTRLRDHCQEDHQSWPAKGRHNRHTAEASRHRRMHAYAADLGALKSLRRQTQWARLGVVDLDTGEIKDV
jgi:hypothetical protein